MTGMSATSAARSRWRLCGSRRREQLLDQADLGEPKLGLSRKAKPKSAISDKSFDLGHVRQRVAVLGDFM